MSGEHSSPGARARVPAAPVITPRHRLVDEAYNAIKGMILSNELTGGQAISVAALADRLGVSRSPVSKAFATLEKEGFVESEPFKTPRVATVSATFVRNVYDVRTILEAAAAAAAVASLSDDDVALLRVHLANLDQAHARDDDDAVHDIDSWLHGFLAERAGNDVLAGFIENLQLHLVRIRSVYKAQIYSEREADIQVGELRSIFAAAIRGDSQAAEAAMREHISRHAQRLIASIDQA